MYQSVIRDPGTGGLIRVVPDVSGPCTAVVNGSILLVPAETTAFVVINGIVSPPYGPGRHELFTGVDPFFVRMRNIMTNGDTGTSVSVFFISTRKEQFFRLGTGEILFHERVHNLTMKALASCNLTFTVSNARRLLEKMVGAYSTSFTMDDLEPCLEQLVLTPVREALSRELAAREIVQFNASLTAISAKASGAIAAAFASYGLQLVRFALTGINVPAEEMQRLNQLEQSRAEGRNRIIEEQDILTLIWNGDVGQRTIAEMLTGISARGGQNAGGGQRGGGMDSTASAMIQAMMLPQIMQMFQNPLNSMVQHTNLFGGTQTPQNREDTPAEAPPPLPGRTRRCPSCNGSVPRNAASCSICGHRF